MKDWVNIDKDPRVNPDVCVDVENGLPMSDNLVDEVYMNDFLEHISNYIFFFNEVYRVCKNGAGIFIQVPYALCDAAFDLDHKSYWTQRKFEQIADPFYSYCGFEGKLRIETNRQFSTDDVTYIRVRYTVIK